MTGGLDDANQINDYPFTRLARIDPSRAEKLRESCGALAKLGSSGKAAADRIHLAGEDIAIFPPANLQAFIDVEGTGADVERERLRSIQWVPTVRNVCVLLPLFFTWLGLSWATWQYALDVSTHPDDKTLSFLQLWEEGFSSRNPIFSFSHFAAVDVALFLVLISIGLYADLTTRSAHQVGSYARGLANQSFKYLVEVSIKVVSGVNIHTDRQEWAGQVHQVLFEVRTILERLGQLLSDREGHRR